MTEVCDGEHDSSVTVWWLYCMTGCVTVMRRSNDKVCIRVT